MSLILILIFIFSCSGGKVTYDFQKDENLNFTSGKWILNKPNTNDNRSKTIQKIALKEFQKLIPNDSLFQVFDLRKTKLIGEQFAFNPSKEDLREIKITSGCDFLINIENRIVGENNDILRFSNPNGVSKKTNEARSIIRIYNLNTLEMISEVTAVAEDKVVEREDSGLKYLTSSILLANKSVVKLISQYKKHTK